MSVLKEQLVKWTNALELFDKKDYDRALDAFSEFAEMSKIHFNCGMVHMNRNDLEGGIESFTRALECDSYFALAFFQRGVLFYNLNEFENALYDWEDCLERLRGNTHIDYTQLGVEYALQECYVLMNIGLAQMQLGDYNTGLRYFDQALAAARNATIDPDTSNINEALRKGETAVDLVNPYELSLKLVFRPQDDNVKNSKKVDYLGKSKVVAAADQKDNFAGFSGHLQKEMTLGRGYRKKIATESLPSPQPSPAREVRRMTRSNSTGNIRDPLPQSSSLSRSATTLDRSNNRPTIGRRTSSAGRIPLSKIDVDMRRQNSDPFRDDLSAIQSASPRGGLSRSKTIDGRSPSTPRSRLVETLPRRDSLRDTQDTSSFDTVRLPRRGTEPLIERPSTPSDYSSDSPRERDSDDKIRVKAYFNGCRLVHVPFDANYDELLDAVRQKFRNQSILLKFVDESGRRARMMNDDDMAEALDLSPDPNRLEVWCYVQE